MESPKIYLKLDIKIDFPSKYSKIRQNLYYKAKKINKKIEKRFTIILYLANSLDFVNFKYLNNLPLF